MSGSAGHVEGSCGTEEFPRMHPFTIPPLTLSRLSCEFVIPSFGEESAFDPLLWQSFRPVAPQFALISVDSRPNGLICIASNEIRFKSRKISLTFSYSPVFPQVLGLLLILPLFSQFLCLLCSPAFKVLFLSWFLVAAAYLIRVHWGLFAAKEVFICGNLRGSAADLCFGGFPAP